VCNVAVAPGARVRVHPGGCDAVTLHVGATGEQYGFDPHGALPGRHPLLEHALAYAPPPNEPVTIAVGAAVPPGCGTGTSAAVVVALLAACAALRGQALSASELAVAAHAVEVGLGLQSGVQDQHAAARGGVQLLEIEYPHAVSTPIGGDDVIAALDDRLCTVWLGRSHRSSEVHEAVIARLEGFDPEPALAPLRAAARDAADALANGDLDAYGAALAANTEAQAALHPGLVGVDARRVIEVARAHGAPGWKVNGAGGDGGTVTVVAPADAEPLRRALARHWELLDLHVSRVGVQVKD